VLGGVLLGTAYPALGLNNEPRECLRVTCSSASMQETLKLSCGGAGEQIASVLFASFGDPEGVCPGANEFDESNSTLKENQDCAAVSSVKSLEGACIGEKECTLVVNETFSEKNEGLENCQASSKLRFVAHVTCEDTFDPLSLVSSLVLAFIGLAVGATVDAALMKDVGQRYKKGVVVGWLCQFGIMPLIGLAFVKIFNFSPDASVGLILASCSPGGSTSNLITYWAKGNVALSVVMTACSTLCAIFMLPLLSFLYLEHALGYESNISIPVGKIFTTLLLLVIPTIIGIMIKSRHEKLAAKLESIGSKIGGAFLLAALVIGILQSPDMLNFSRFSAVWVAGILFQPIGCFFGYWIAYFTGLPRREMRAVCLETGLQNFILAIAVVSSSIAGCRRIEMLLFPLVGGACYFVNSAWLALFLRWTATFDEAAPSASSEDQKPPASKLREDGDKAATPTRAEKQQVTLV